MDNDTSESPPPLCPSIEALLAYEREIVPLPEDTRLRALARARKAAGAPFSPPTVTSPLRRLFFAAAAGLLASVAVGYHMRRSRPQPQPSPVAEPPALAPKASPPSHRFQFSGERQGQTEELRFLISAKQADSREDYLSVLTLLAEHERSFPAGRLAEEREILRVKALIGLHRLDEAREAAARFRRLFPHSVLLTKLDDLLAQPT